VLRELDDEVTVWLEETEPQALIVLDPCVGLLVLEASGESARSLQRSGILGRFRQGQPKLERSPRLTDLAGHYRAQLEERRGLTAPILAANALALPNMRSSMATRAGIGPDEFPYVLFQEELEVDRLRHSIAKMIGDSRPRLGEIEERIARAAVRPEIVINRRDAPADAKGQLVFQMPEDEDLIKVLDRQQERLAHHLGPGYRVIRGVAGSGKTLVLVFRARHLAHLAPRQKFLITCYNVVLSKALEQQVVDVPNVHVATIDSIAYRHSAIRPSRDEPDEWRRAREQAAKALRSNQALTHYDGVFVDEAQDLDTAGLDLAYACLRHGSDNFVIALDGAQNIFRKRALWNPPGVTARGRTTILKRCYRNTKEIAGFAWRFLTAANLGILADEDAEDPTLVVPPELTERHGPEPVVLQCSSADSEVDEIVRRIEAAHARGVPWGQMAVLYGKAKPWQTTLYFRLKGKGIPYHWVTMNPQSRRDAISVGDVVRASTLQALKGVEFSKVFICGVNAISDPGGDDELTRFKLAYVGMTRAMDELVITISGTGPIGRAIQQARAGTGASIVQPPRAVPLPPRRAAPLRVGPSEIAKPLPKARPPRTSPSPSGHTRYEQEVARVSPIPDEYSRAHPFLFEAERLESEGAPDAEIDKLLEKARAADGDAYRFYAARKKIQRQLRDDAAKGER
jgi:hypothetical protein